MIKTSVSQELHENGWENGCCLKEFLVKYKAPQNHWDRGKVEKVSVEFWNKGRSVTRFLDASQGFYASPLAIQVTFTFVREEQSPQMFVWVQLAADILSAAPRDAEQKYLLAPGYFCCTWCRSGDATLSPQPKKAQWATVPPAIALGLGSRADVISFRTRTFLFLSSTSSCPLTNRGCRL